MHSVGRLADALGLRQPTVSHHMKALADEGIVVRQPEGRRVWYSLDPRQVDRVDALLGDDSVPPEVEPGPRPDRRRPRRALPRRVQPPRQCRPHVAESHELLSARIIRRSCSPRRTAAFATTRLDALEPRRARTRRRLPRSCSCACRTPVGLSSPRGSSGSSPGIECWCAPRAPPRPTRCARRVVTALDEIGVPLGGEFPKPLTDEAVRAADVVVTMGCGDACPVYPGRRYLDWDIEDPVGKPIARCVRFVTTSKRACAHSLAELVPADRSPIRSLNQ